MLVLGVGLIVSVRPAAMARSPRAPRTRRGWLRARATGCPRNARGTRADAPSWTARSCSPREPGWPCDAREDCRENGFRRLRDYAEQHGDPRVPLSYLDVQFNLDEWLHNQRCAQGRGRARRQPVRPTHGAAGAVVATLLRPMGRGTSTDWRRASRVTAMLQSPGSHDDGLGLGAWVRTQRLNYARSNYPARPGAPFGP